MYTISTAVQTLLGLAKQEIHAHSVLVFNDDLFEVTKTPSVIFNGPKLIQDHFRSPSRFFEKDLVHHTYQEFQFPKLYHLDFECIVTVDRQIELLEFQESFSRFLQKHPVIYVEAQGEFNLTELQALGGSSRVNLSNLKQSTARIRIESVPVWLDKVGEGSLISSRSFQFHGSLDEQQSIRN